MKAKEKTKFLLNKKFTVSGLVQRNVLALNTCYIISLDDDDIISVYNINTKQTINLNFSSSLIKFHPKIENMFIIIQENIAKIFEINNSNFSCVKRSDVEGHTQEIKIVDFFRHNYMLFATYSNDKTIKIWNFYKAFCLFNILLTDPINNFQIYSSSIYYYNKTKSCLIKYNINEYKQTDYNWKVGNVFVVLKNEEIASLSGNYLTKYSKKDENKYLKLNTPMQMFYDSKYDHLYIFCYSEIKVVEMKKMEIILTKQIAHFKAFYINNCSDNNDIISFLIFLNENIDFFEFYSVSNENKARSYNYFLPGSEFFKDIPDNICGMENVSWEANKDEDLDNIIYKKYLDFPDIKLELEENYKKSLSRKKKEVNDGFDKNKNYSYKELIKMLIKDNTNKNLVAKYLNYLNDNKDQKEIKEEVNFENEYENYKIMFNKEELESYKLKNKLYSQKEEFINTLKDIMELESKDYNTFEEKAKKKLERLQLFNQPIDFTNKELYWYRNNFVLYHSLKGIFESKDPTNNINLMKENITNMNERGIFNKNYIMDNFELLTSVIYLVSFPQGNDIIQFNLNLIQTLDPENNNNKSQEIKLNKNKKPNSNDNTSSLDDEHNKCMANIILNKDYKMDLQSIELKNYINMQAEFNDIIEFDKMKNFLSKMICSKVFREAFKILYPKEFQFPFEDEKDALSFLEKYFHFIPLKSSRSCAITEKFSLEIFYFLKAKTINIDTSLNNQNKNMAKKILYRGSVIVNCSHEINHEFYNIFLMHSNGKIPINTPRKKFINENKGGNNMEKLLFNQKIKRISIKQCIYLLNEKNYEKSLPEFKKGFNELKKEDLKIDENDGIFKECNSILNMNNFEEISIKSNIKCNDEDINSDYLIDSYVDDIGIDNDILGIIRDPSKL